jgi:hypothetical protein
VLFVVIVVEKVEPAAEPAVITVVLSIGEPSLLATPTTALVPEIDPWRVVILRTTLAEKGTGTKTVSEVEMFFNFTRMV